MPDPMTLLSLFALLLAIGFIAGILAGMLGVGGGIVLVPGFYYAFSALGYESDVLMRICLATSLATIIVTSIRSVLSHHKRGAVDWAILRGWAPGIVIGALLGMAAVSSLRSAQLQMIFAVLALIIASYLAFGRQDWRLSEQMPRGIVRALISPLIGFFSVLMGIGGGSFAVPLMSLNGVPIHRAVATSAGFGLVIAAPSVAGFLLVPVPADLRPPGTVGAVNLPAFLTVIAMTMLSAPLGVRLAHGMDAKLLRRIFAAFLAIVALNMLRKAMGG